jgi:hypothetical protein
MLLTGSFPEERDRKMTELIPSAWLCDAVDIDEIERDWLDKPGPAVFQSRNGRN